ncbi:MAG: helix-turn-helix domain-containing protein [Aeromonas sp.]
MKPNILQVGHKIRHMREALGYSRPKFAQLLDVPATTLKNYELGYREVGGSFLIALTRHPQFYPYTLWLMTDKTAESVGQIKPPDQFGHVV